LVIEMTRSASASLLASEFDSFLFAPIGEERNGMLLSVLSALARLDVDPWQEAAKLALLPAETATQRLASLITSLPDGSSIDRDPTTIAARLIALLPHSATPDAPPRKTWHGVAAAPNLRAVISMIVINAIFMAFLLGTQSIMTNHRPPAPTDKDHAQAASAVSPQIKSPSSD
jgi:hypothetical protein